MTTHVTRINSDHSQYLRVSFSAHTKIKYFTLLFFTLTFSPLAALHATGALRFHSTRLSRIERRDCNLCDGIRGSLITLEKGCIVPLSYFGFLLKELEADFLTANVTIQNNKDKRLKKNFIGTPQRGFSVKMRLR